MNNCPICHKRIVTPTGPANAKVLVIGDKPDFEEIQTGIPFSGKTGTVLKTEMGRAGLQLQMMRQMTLWQHAVPGKKDPNRANCRDTHMQATIKEMTGREIVLLCGAESSAMFELPPISSISSLIVESDYFPPGVIVIASSSPGMAVSARHGELRLALARLKEVYEEVVA